MKKIAIMVMAALMMTACIDKKTSASDTDLTGDSLSIAIDSIGVSVNLVADIPGDNVQLQRTLAAYIADQLFSDAVVSDSQEIAPAYNDDLHTFFTACVRRKWQELERATFAGYPETLDDDEAGGLTTAEAREEAARAFAEDSICLSSANYAFRKKQDNDSIIIWQYDYILFVAGAAHPSIGSECFTVRKKDTCE